MNHEIFGYLSGAILLLAIPIYLRGIYKYNFSSNRVTWGVWILVNALFCFSYYKSVGLVSSIWVPFVYLFSIIVIFIFLIKFGRPGSFTWVEKNVLISIPLILIFWFFSKSAIAVLTLTLLIDILGSIPLIITLWKNSKADYATAWYIGFIANFLNLFAIEKWDYANAIYPVYLVLLTFVCSILLSRRTN